MGRWIAFFFCVIGVLAFASMVKAQDPHGTPGVDYPNYFTIPETSFKCSEQEYNPGFYADIETQCQAFHFCYQDRQESFLCPTGTIFNQAVLTCDVWYKSNCSLAQMYYSVNAGPVMERAGKNLPMLLRLRNRSPNKPSPQTSTASVFDKVSSLYGTETESPSETLITPKDSEKIETNEKPIESAPEDLDSTKKQIIVNGESEQDANKDLENEEFTNEMDTDDMVYDTVNDGYYEKNDQYEDEWQEAEPVSDEFSNFYDYRDQSTEYETDEREFPSDYVNDESYEDSDVTVVEDSDYPEFEKRSQIGYTRSRRKPVYVVLDDEPEAGEQNEADNEPDAMIESDSEGKENNLTSEESVGESTSSPESLPHSTPSNLNTSKETSKSSEESEPAVLSELVLPKSPEDYEVIPSTYSQDNQGPFVESDQTDDEFSDSEDDETIYIENDIEPERYEPYSSQYEDVVVVPDSGEEAYVESYSESPDDVGDQSDTEDTFVVIPDEYDNTVDSNEDDFETADYPEQSAYETEILADSPAVAVYDDYSNSYQYSPNMDYSQHYAQTNYPEQVETYQNFVPTDQRYSYEEDYEMTDQPPTYENSEFETENTYTPTELYPYAEPESNSEERLIELPVTEADKFQAEDLNVADSETDLIVVPEETPNQAEDVYYVLEDTDEEPSEGNETKASEVNEKTTAEDPTSEKSEQVNEYNHEIKQSNSSESESVSTENVAVDNESEQLDESTQEEDVWPLTENEQTKTVDESTQEEDVWPMTENEQTKTVNIPPTNTDKASTSAASNLVQDSQQKQSAYENLASLNTPSFSSSMGNYDFSTDPRFLSSMAYSESMDFGPYGFGPNMPQQFSMMESMPQARANPFNQRMGKYEQPKSPLSALQERMRSMKQGKFGAFKKFMSSTRK